MEDTYPNLRLYMPISERSCRSPCRGPSSPSKASLSFHQTLTPKCEEEGPAETVRLEQADRFVLTDLKETLKALDDSSEIRWLTELLPLCLECRAFMSMGNQQGTKLKTNYHSYVGSRDTSPKTPRIQIPRRRRRAAEGICNLQHKLKMTPKTPRVPPKARRLTKLQGMSSPVFEQWHLDDNSAIICTPAARRKRGMGKDRAETSVSLLEERNRRSLKQLKPAWGAKLPDASSANVHRSKDEFTLVDSDSDSSAYDNDTYSMFISQSSIDPTGKTEDRVRNTGIPGEALVNQLASHRHEERKADGVEKKSSQWRFEETGKRAAAQRVMGKIEEVEEIIRRVSLTSSEWMKEGSKWGDVPQFISDRCVGEDQLPILQQRCTAESSSHCSLDNQDRQSNEDKLLLVEELWALVETMSQSRHQALKIEGAQTESEPFTEAKKTSCEQNSVKSTRRPSHDSHFTSNCSMVPNNSLSPSLSAGGETSSAPSLSLSTTLDVSPRASSSFEKMSPILSPVFLSSPGSSQRSVPLNLSAQSEPDTSEDPIMGTVEDSLFPWGAGGCGCATAVSMGTENNKRTQATLRLNEQSQTQSYRCTSETETSQEYLLFSGNNAAMSTK